MRCGPHPQTAASLLDTPYVRRGFVADDLFNHFVASQSTYSVSGRRRLQNRWLRLSRHIDWTQAA